MDGILLFDKPILWTSHDAVDFLRKKLGQKSVGHAGTLDPLATGLLIMLLGKATKLSNTLTSLDKDYVGAMSLGFTTDTQDLEGRICDVSSRVGSDESRVRAVFKELLGSQTQFPPVYSAVKQNGRKLYQLARAGASVDIKPRQVMIHSFVPTRIEETEVSFSLTCSKGAYVRSLCDEVGKRLGCGATLSALVRTRTGPFKLAHAVNRDEVSRTPADILERLLVKFDPGSYEYLSRN